ncbi:MAG: hypothetical protein M3Q56_07975 [Bacteroidota bacterium]|nr:hypothetical protein [Bacteroidota bacterium]
MEINTQIFWLFILPLAIACISWTFTSEELFREISDYFIKRSQHEKSFLKRKFYYLFTCEYCFSHYITIIFLFLTDYKLLINDWRGTVIAGFSLVWIANIYMNLYGLIRQEIKKDKKEIKILEKKSAI